MSETYSIATVVRVDGKNPATIPSGDSFQAGPVRYLPDSVAWNPDAYQRSAKSFLAKRQDGSVYWATLTYGFNGEMILVPAHAP